MSSPTGPGRSWVVACLGSSGTCVPASRKSPRLPGPRVPGADPGAESCARPAESCQLWRPCPRAVLGCWWRRPRQQHTGSRLGSQQDIHYPTPGPLKQPSLKGPRWGDQACPRPRGAWDLGLRGLRAGQHLARGPTLRCWEFSPMDSLFLRLLALGPAASTQPTARPQAPLDLFPASASSRLPATCRRNAQRELFSWIRDAVVVTL